MATFMDLPPELRLQIYQNLKGTRPLPMERNIQYVVSRYTDSTAILQTNRTIYNEASFILDHKAEGIRITFTVHQCPFPEFHSGIIRHIETLMNAKSFERARHRTIVFEASEYGEIYAYSGDKFARFWLLLLGGFKFGGPWNDALAYVDWTCERTAEDAEDKICDASVGEVVPGEVFSRRFSKYYESEDWCCF